MKQGSSLLALGPLSQLENQKLEKETINSVLQTRHIWVSSNIIVLGCYVQFYKPKNGCTC
jgi:hypothetical protein